MRLSPRRSVEQSSRNSECFKTVFSLLSQIVSTEWIRTAHPRIYNLLILWQKHFSFLWVSCAYNSIRLHCLAQVWYMVWLDYSLIYFIVLISVSVYWNQYSWCVHSTMVGGARILKSVWNQCKSSHTHISRQVMAGCECVVCMFCFSPLCFGKGCVVIKLSKLSEIEWNKILFPSVYSLTHTHKWPLIHFGLLRENLPCIIPTWIELCI